MGIRVPGLVFGTGWCVRLGVIVAAPGHFGGRHYSIGGCELGSEARLAVQAGKEV